MMVTLGVDVSKEKLDLALWIPDTRKKYARVRPNHARGAQELLAWAMAKSKVQATQIRVVMEATGPYHEAAALTFHAAGCQVVVANPVRVRDYAKGRGQLTKNDRVDSYILALYGQEDDKFTLWEPPAPEMLMLRSLLGRIDALEEDLQRELNRQEKARATPATPDLVHQSLARNISAIQVELERLRRQLDDHIDLHPQLKKDEKLLTSIPGIGQITARRLIALLRGHRFVSARQAAAYIGLSVIGHESGKTIKERPRLARNGDARMRAALYFPAVSASTYNPPARALSQRLIRAGKPTKSALAAVMRKLVHIAFGVLKHQTPFNPALSTIA